MLWQCTRPAHSNVYVRALLNRAVHKKLQYRLYGRANTNTIIECATDALSLHIKACEAKDHRNFFIEYEVVCASRLSIIYRCSQRHSASLTSSGNSTYDRDKPIHTHTEVCGLKYETEPNTPSGFMFKRLGAKLFMCGALVLMCYTIRPFGVLWVCLLAYHPAQCAWHARSPFRYVCDCDACISRSHRAALLFVRKMRIHVNNLYTWGDRGECDEWSSNWIKYRKRTITDCWKWAYLEWTWVARVKTHLNRI